MKRVTPVAFPPGWLRLDTSPMVTGSRAKREHDRDGRGRRLGGERGGVAAGRRDHHHRTFHECGREPRQPVVSALRPLIVDHDVLAFDEAEIAQATMKFSESRADFRARAAAEKADDGDGGLLRSRPRAVLRTPPHPARR